MLTLKVLDKNNNIKNSSTGDIEVNLVNFFEYEDGDTVQLESTKYPVYIWIQVDDALGASLCYITDKVSFTIPMGEKRICYSPKCFIGNKHYLYGRIARPDDISAYRNLALNVLDVHGDVSCYPHAFANVETRGESVFAARNAIDGVTENRSHGEWPYESWGINMQDDAEMTIDFGREVEIDKIILYTRSDFPHDNWWKQVSFLFSDESEIDFKMEKSYLPHECNFSPKKVSWVKFYKLLKADDPSPFPALSQIQIFGKDNI